MILLLYGLAIALLCLSGIILLLGMLVMVARGVEILVDAWRRL